MGDAASSGRDGARIAVRPDALARAAGGYDVLVEDLADKQFSLLQAPCDTGHTGLDAAITAFAESWNAGLATLVERQQDRAMALRRAASLVLDTDVDTAYVFGTAEIPTP